MIRANGVRLAAWVFAALSAVVMLFHTAAIFGAPVGHLTMGARWPGVLPPAARLLSLLSLVVIGLTAMVVLARAGVIKRTLPSWNMRAVLAYLTLAIPVKGCSNTNSTSSRLYSEGAYSRTCAVQLDQDREVRNHNSFGY